MCHLMLVPLFLVNWWLILSMDSIKIGFWQEYFLEIHPLPFTSRYTVSGYPTLSNAIIYLWVQSIILDKVGISKETSCRSQTPLKDKWDLGQQKLEIFQMRREGWLV